MITDEQYAKAMDALQAFEQEQLEHNAKIMEQIIDEVGNKAIDSYKQILDNAYVRDKIEIVSKPDGYNQNEKCGVFTEVWVDQWGVGMEGDSFDGFIFGKFAKQKWLKIPYSC